MCSPSQSEYPLPRSGVSDTHRQHAALRAGGPRQPGGATAVCSTDVPAWYTTIDSPLGRICLAGTRHGLIRVDFQQGERPVWFDPTWQEDATALETARQQCEEYFAGQRRVFSLRLAPAGTPFQQRVWQALQRIPFGSTWTYGQLAQHLGMPRAARAIGHANGRNPLAIVIPCHRLVGSDGRLRGYAGGIERKQRLLQHEGVQM